MTLEVVLVLVLVVMLGLVAVLGRLSDDDGPCAHAHELDRLRKAHEDALASLAKVVHQRNVCLETVRRLRDGNNNNHLKERK